MFISTWTDQIFWVSYPFLAVILPPVMASTIGCLLIPGGRYEHFAWLRTTSDTISSLGPDP